MHSENNYYNNNNKSLIHLIYLFYPEVQYKLNIQQSCVIGKKL